MQSGINVTSIDQLLELLVMPEIRRRQENGSAPMPFPLRQALVLWRPEGGVDVRLNEEVSFAAVARAAAPVDANQKLQAHHIAEIEAVEHPKIDGQRVAWLYARNYDDHWEVVFDFTPNHPRSHNAAEAEEQHSALLTDLHRADLRRMVVESARPLLSDLHHIGLWLAPALIPHPLGQISHLIRSGKPNEAIELFVSHCTPGFVRDLASEWWDLPEFASRRSLLDDVIKAYERREYGLVIYAVIPQIEGIVTDWLYRDAKSSVTWRQESKTKQFRDVALTKLTPGIARETASSMLEFVLKGPVLAHFDDWTAPLGLSFVSRHVVGHGRYDAALLTDGHAAKTLLLLDSLAFTIAQIDAQSRIEASQSDEGSKSQTGDV